MSVGIFRYVGFSSIIFFAASIHQGNPPEQKGMSREALKEETNIFVFEAEVVVARIQEQMRPKFLILTL